MELVIVIGVIAVLAAVLIPTFSSLIRKANISSDTVLAKNLNTAVSLYKAENGNKDMTFEDALKAAKERGYVLGNLNAKAKDCYFVWENQSDQFLLIEKIKEEPKYNVLFNIADGFYQYDETKGEDNKKWYFSASDLEVINNLKQVFSLASFVKVAASATDLITMFNASNNETIYVNDNFSFTENDVIQPNGDQQITIDLNSNEISLIRSNPKLPLGYTGNLKIQNGSVNSSKTADGSGWGFTVRGGGLQLENVIMKTYTDNTIRTLEGKSDISITDSSIELISEYNVFNLMSPKGIIRIKDSKIKGPRLFYNSFQTTSIVDGCDIINTKKTIAWINNSNEEKYDTVEEYKNNNINPTTIIYKDSNISFGNHANGLTNSPETDEYMFEYGTQGWIMNNTVVVFSGGTINGLDYLEYFRRHTDPDKTSWNQVDNKRCLKLRTDNDYHAFYIEKEINGKVVIFLEFRSDSNYDFNNFGVIDYVLNNNLLNQ